MKVMSTWMRSEMAPAWGAVYVERIRSGQPAYGSQCTSDAHKNKSREKSIVVGFRRIRTGQSGGRQRGDSCVCA